MTKLQELQQQIAAIEKTISQQKYNLRSTEDDCTNYIKVRTAREIDPIKDAIRADSEVYRQKIAVIKEVLADLQKQHNEVIVALNKENFEYFPHGAELIRTTSPSRVGLIKELGVCAIFDNTQKIAHTPPEIGATIFIFYKKDGNLSQKWVKIDYWNKNQFTLK